jgi:hypothetical protein
MNAEEKADDFLNRFENILISANADSWNKEAKQCALICVDELIESYGNYTGMYDQDFFDSEKRYWQQVKSHIENK